MTLRVLLNLAIKLLYLKAFCSSILDFAPSVPARVHGEVTVHQIKVNISKSKHSRREDAACA